MLPASKPDKLSLGPRWHSLMARASKAGPGAKDNALLGSRRHILVTGAEAASPGARQQLG